MFKKKRSTSNQQVNLNNGGLLNRRRYERILTQQSSSQTLSNKARGNNTFEKSSPFRPQRLPINTGSREPQVVAEENLNLKKFINDLQNQLHIQRSKVQSSQRKAMVLTTKFGRQFGKDIYYSCKHPNSYMISGVKQQYERMKQQCQKKEQEMADLLRIAENTDAIQVRIYVDELENQNRKLIEQLNSVYQIGEKVKESEMFGDKSKKFRTGESAGRQKESYGQSSEVLSALWAQQRSKLVQSQSINEGLTKKCLQKQQLIQEKIKKIEFLQKLLIQKDNNEHRARRQKSKAQQHSAALQEKLNAVTKQFTQYQRLFEQRLKATIDRQILKSQQQKQIFLRTLEDKNQEIGKLEKEIRFLATVLSYWKPLDEINREFLREGAESGSKQRSDRIFQEIEAGRINAGIVRKKDSVYSQNANKLIDLIEVPSQKESFPRSNTMNQNLRITNAGLQSSSHNENFQEKREPRTCTSRHSQNAIKTRKINLSQIKQLSEMLRYRMIGFGWPIDEVRSLFDAADECQDIFQVQHITMREVKSIIRQKPFMLSQQQAVRMSRYLVQDSTESFVYWDESNQVRRQIVKSIIKAFMGQYVIEPSETVQVQWQGIKQQYESNLRPALAVLAPKGKIAAQKLKQLIQGLGLQIRESMKQWMIGTMLVNSTSLQELNYQVLIPL